MSFSFQFDDEDIEADYVEVSNNSRNGLGTAINPLDQTTEGMPAEKLILEDLLQSLKGVSVTFSSITTKNNITIYRRELFDVKHQLMAEDDGDEDVDILMGDNDLQKNIYEGGLKTWECSIDLVDSLSTGLVSDLFNSAAGGHSRVIELGSGTSLPSCYLLQRLLQEGKKSKVTFVLSDYNKSVLRIATVPNLVISWWATLDVERQKEISASFEIHSELNDLIQITESLIENFKQDLQANNIDITILAGAWSRAFLDKVVASNVPTIVLTSETIYSPEVFPTLAEIIVELLSENANNKALVAAKDIYFGVGGSVVEFLKYLDTKRNHVRYTVQQINSKGLNRSIISISNA